MYSFLIGLYANLLIKIKLHVVLTVKMGKHTNPFPILLLMILSGFLNRILASRKLIEQKLEYYDGKVDFYSVNKYFPSTSFPWDIFAPPEDDESQFSGINPGPGKLDFLYSAIYIFASSPILLLSFLLWRIMQFYGSASLHSLLTTGSHLLYEQFLWCSSSKPSCIVPLRFGQDCHRDQNNSHR